MWLIFALMICNLLNMKSKHSFYFFFLSRNTAYALYFPLVQLHTTKSGMQVSQQDFEKARDQLKLLKTDPGNEVKLKLYALFKQVIPDIFIL